MTFRGLQAESVVQGHVHKSISNELHTLVADPFEQWALNYNVTSFLLIFLCKLMRSSAGSHQGKQSHRPWELDEIL